MPETTTRYFTMSVQVPAGNPDFILSSAEIEHVVNSKLIAKAGFTAVAEAYADGGLRVQVSS